MDIELECNFIKNAIKKNKIDRVCYELALEEKRDRAISRFHNPREIVETAKAVDVTRLPFEKLLAYITKNLNVKNCYIISYHEDLNGKTFELSLDVLNQCFDDGFPLIMIFDAENGIVFGEQCVGPADKFLVNNKKL